MPKAIIIGSLNMDIVAYVKQHPKLGETIVGSNVKYFPGGKGANQAVACKRLGCETLMVGSVGNDAFGQALLSFQRNEGIHVASVKQRENIATGTAFITVSKSAENTIVVIPGANGVWDDDFLVDINVEIGDIVLSQFEVPDMVIAQAFTKAKSLGAITMLNPAPIRNVSHTIREHTDILIVNEHELAQLSNTLVESEDDHTVFAAMKILEQTGYQTIITTLGNKGVRLLKAGEPTRIEPHHVNAIDTTGAGDTFIGGLAAGLLANKSFINAAELANIAAAISVTREGAASAIPTFDEIEPLLK